MLGFIRRWVKREDAKLLAKYEAAYASSLKAACQQLHSTVKAEAVPVESHRLTQEVYKQLERDLLRLAVGPTTTELQAGYQLGVAAVLEKLRNGIVIGG